MVFRLTERACRNISFLTLALILAGCSLNEREVAGVELSVPEGNYRLQEVLPEGALLLSNEDAQPFKQYVIWRDSDIKPLTLPADPRCHRSTGYERPGMLPDKRLGFVKFCLKWPDRPVGQSIAFVASAKAIDYDDIRRARAPYNLYLMSLETLEPVKVLGNITGPNLLKWSPDSSWLLLDGCMGWISKCGLWVFEPETKRVTLIAIGDFWGADWMSNEEIVSSLCIGEELVCKEYKLIQYDISAIVNR